jgi:hypothetical protein
MNSKVFAIAVLLVLGSFILSLIPISPQLNAMPGRWSYPESERAACDNTSPSNQANDVTDNLGSNDGAENSQSKSQENSNNEVNLEQPNSALSENRVENRVETISESMLIPCEGFVEKTENQTLPVRLDAVLLPIECEPVQFTQP